MTAIFLQGHVTGVLQRLSPDMFHCVVTSPPYFGLRKYDGDQGVVWSDGWEGSLGNEPTPSLYIAHLVEIFREVRRVLRPDGVCWLNIGDSYAGSGKGQMGNGEHAAKHGEKQHTVTGCLVGGLRTGVAGGFKAKDAYLIPQRLAIALQEDGWYVRSDVIWNKKNPMPESVDGWRFTRHRVTIEEYERLQNLWPAESANTDGSGDLPGMPSREVSSCEAKVSTERQGETCCASEGRTSRCPSNTAGVCSKRQGKGESRTIQGEARGEEEGSGTNQEVAADSERQDYNCSNGEKAQSESYSASQASRVSSAVPSHAQREGDDGQAQCSAILLGDEHRSPVDSISVASGAQGESLLLPLLPEESQPDSRSCDSFEQGRSAHHGERSTSLPKLQLQEARQSARTLVDCPGCDKCKDNGGFVLRKGSWRPTDSHEHILMLTKSASYYCDKSAVLEPVAPSTINRGPVDFGGAKGRDYRPTPDDPNFRNGKEQWGRTFDYRESCANGRNLRSVWEFPTAPFSGGHYAAYPPRLVETTVKASTPSKGCCPKCHSPYARIVDKGLTAHDGETNSAYATGSTANRLALLWQAARERGEEYTDSTKSLGWKPSCGCAPGAEPTPALVLDPFSGAGTTAMVCERLGLNSFNIDISEEYIQIARDRLAADKVKLGY